MINDAQFEAKQELQMIKQELAEKYEVFKKEKEQMGDDLKTYEDQAEREVREIQD